MRIKEREEPSLIYPETWLHKRLLAHKERIYSQVREKKLSKSLLDQSYSRGLDMPAVQGVSFVLEVQGVRRIGRCEEI